MIRLLAPFRRRRRRRTAAEQFADRRLAVFIASLHPDTSEGNRS